MSDSPNNLTNTRGDLGGFPIPTDFNGDAKTDILYAVTKQANPYPQFHFTKYMAKGDYPDLVNKIDNGIGGQTMISHKPLTDTTVYSKEESDSTDSLPACSLINKISGATFQIRQTDPSTVTGASFPTATVQFPVYAVADYTKNDGRGNSYQYNYYYNNAKVDHNGRGWLGFETIIKKDILARIDKMAAFWQAFPFIGRIKYIQIQCGEGCKDPKCSSKGILSRQNFSYLCQPGSSCSGQWPDIYQPFPGIYQVRLQKHIKDYYDYNTYEFSTAQTFTYDKYGNLIVYSNYNYTDQQGNDRDPSDNSYNIRKYVNYDEDGKYALGYLLASLVTTNDDVSKISDISCGKKPGFNEDTDFRLRAYSYDEQMNMTCRCSWDNGEEKQVWLTYNYEYDDFGHKIKITDPAGNTTAVTYETTYHTFPDKKTTPPNQNGESLTYYYGFDPRFGIRVASTDPNGNTNITVLDDLGRTIANQGPVPDNPPGITPSENNVSSWVTGSYNFSKAKVVTLSTFNYSINDSNNMFIEERVLQNWPVNGSSGETSWNRKYYDGLGRNYKIVSSGGECEGKGNITIDYTFDAAGNITEQTLPYFQGDTSYSIKNIFNAYNRVIKITSPAGEKGDETSVTTSDYQWDSDGFTVTETQAAENNYKYVKKMKYRYFNSGAKVVSMVIPGDNDNNATTTYDYDLLARAISATDPFTESNPKGLTGTVSYDSRGRKHQIYNPHHGAISFTFDKEGKLYKKTDSNGTTTFSYDRLGRITGRLLADNSKVVYTYDAPKVANSKGKKSKVSIISSDDTVKAGYDLQYNKYGKISQVSLSINGETDHFVTKLLYDPLGRVYSYTYPDGNVLEKVYNACYLKELNMDGQNYVTYSNYNALGAPTNITYGNGVNTQHTYDPTGKLCSYLIQDPTGQILQHDSLTWNHLDLVTKITDRDGSGIDYSQTFDYENLRLIKASSGDTYGTLEYDYDESGNMIFKDGVTYTYSKHQVIKGTTNGTTIFSSAYDDMGNMKTMTLDSITYDYEYNPENRLTKVTRGDNNGSTSFQYNHMGRRIKKVSPDGTKTIYVSPNYQVTTFPDNSSKITKYITGIHGKIASIRTGTAAPDVSLLYLHQNQVASTVLTTDSAGAVSNRLFYLPYGKLYQPIEKDDFRPKYTGKEYDSNTDLYYYGARYYNPEIGRFITADNGLGGHKARQDAFNRYSYTFNNPVKYMDPTGGFPVAACLKISVGVILTGVFAYDFIENWINDSTVKDKIVSGAEMTASAFFTSHQIINQFKKRRDNRRVHPGNQATGSMPNDEDLSHDESDLLNENEPGMSENAGSSEITSQADEIANMPENETNTENLPGGEDGLGDSTEMGSGDMAESSVDASSEVVAEVGAEMETEVGTEIGAEAGAEVGAEVVADVGLEAGTEIAVDILGLLGPLSFLFAL